MQAVVWLVVQIPLHWKYSTPFYSVSHTFFLPPFSSFLGPPQCLSSWTGQRHFLSHLSCSKWIMAAAAGSEKMADSSERQAERDLEGAYTWYCSFILPLLPISSWIILLPLLRLSELCMVTYFTYLIKATNTHCVSFVTALFLKLHGSLVEFDFAFLSVCVQFCLGSWKLGRDGMANRQNSWY